MIPFESVIQRNGDRCGGQHLPESQQAGANAVAAVQVVILAAIDPGPKNQAEQQKGESEAAPAGVPGDMVGQLSDGGYVHQVVEQFEPADFSLVFAVVKIVRRSPPGGCFVLRHNKQGVVFRGPY